MGNTLLGGLVWTGSSISGMGTCYTLFPSLPTPHISEFAHFYVIDATFIPSNLVEEP